MPYFENIPHLPASLFESSFTLYLQFRILSKGMLKNLTFLAFLADYL